MENSMEILHKAKNRTTIWLIYSIPGYISRRIENTNPKWYVYHNVCSDTVYNSQDMEATHVPINRWSY